MRTKFIKFMFAGILIASSHLANAGLIPTTAQVTLDGKNWAKTSIFSGLSWNLINAQCPNGVCSATSELNGFELDGWIWATSAEVQSVFNVFSLSNEFTLGDGSLYYSYRSTWAHVIVSIFGKTASTQTSNELYGLVSNEIRGYGQLLSVIHNYNTLPSIPDRPEPDVMWSTAWGKNLASTNISGWFYQAPASVPEPSTLAILALGMIGLASRRFKKQS